MKHSVRNWHTWASLALGVPLLLVGLTTFFIAHDKALGTRDIMVPVDWLGEPAGARAGAPEIRASLQHAGAPWLGTTRGVFRVEDGRARPLAGGPQDEIRDLLAAADAAVLMAGKKGLWRYADGRAEQLAAGDCWQLAGAGAGYVAACKDAGLLASADGLHWEARPVAFAAQAAQAVQGVPLQRVVMDIHTGKLFFGKQGEWIWIDLLGLCTVGLALTGLLMWMRARRARAGGGAV